MLVKQVIKSKKGTYEFQGELSDEQFNYIFGVGLAYLLDAGADLHEEESSTADDGQAEFKFN